jgi:hypothetical protein
METSARFLFLTQLDILMRMKNSFRAVIGLLLMAGAAHAQDFEALRDKKLQEPFLSKASWITDYDKAREESKKSGKPIFAYFTRSYAG